MNGAAGTGNDRRCHTLRRRVRLAGGAVTAIVALFLASGCGAGRRPARANHRVAIKAMRYDPAVLRVALGDTVRWTNFDLVPHTVTSRTQVFDSGSLAPDSSWVLVIESNRDAGYTCQFHPTMSGSLVVAR